jgi:hypothetical protein
MGVRTCLSGPDEWQLHKQVGDKWAAEGAVLDGERLYLVAREVMADWDTNDAAVRWKRTVNRLPTAGRARPTCGS